MKYDFETVINRRNTGAEKWELMILKKPNVSEEIVPLSVADMEFVNPPELTNGLQQFIANNVFGYTNATEAYYDAVIGWMAKRHKWNIEREWIELSSGVVPALGDLISAYTDIDDGVIIMPPVYYPFRGSVQQRGRKVVECPLLCLEEGYVIDYDNLEEKAKEPKNKLLIFCNPHNPVGRVWTKKELERVVEICARNNVFIIDDEIHNDLIMPGYHHTVLSTISEEAERNCAVCTAPSKSFNLAGLQTSNIIIKDEHHRKQYRKEKSRKFSEELNCFGYQACRIVYTQCEDWLDECIKVIDMNAKYVKRFMKDYFPEVRVFPLEGTYLQWLDLRSLGYDYKELEKILVEEAELFFNEGYIFGKQGEGFERINLACPHSVIIAAMERFKKTFEL